jgi:predicted PhzF superfamily epimerase YddE/YHI9
VLASPEAVRDLRPSMDAILALPGGALIVTAQGGEDADITSRYFAPGYGIAEDPVTGALHTQVVPYWAEILGRSTLRCYQASARGGWLMCENAPPRVRLAGTAVLYAQGEIKV